jgi:hypothetical protein
MKAYGEVEVQLPSVLALEHQLANLFTLAMYGRLGGSHGQSGHFRENQNTLFVSGTEMSHDRQIKFGKYALALGSDFFLILLSIK